MKWNAKAVFTAVLEYITLLAPPIGYSIYAYVSTLQYTLTEGQVASFWATFGIAVASIIIVFIGHKRFKTLYDRYTQSYVQQKTDLETRPNDEVLIEKVASKAKVVESLDYVAIGIPLLIVTLLLYILQSAIGEVIGILTMTTCGILGKAGIHTVTVYLKAANMKKSIEVKKK